MAQIQIENNELQIGGQLDQQAVCELAKQPIDLVKGENYQLNLNSLDHIDSAGLAYLVNLVSQQRLSGGDIRVTALTEQLKQLIELSDVGMMFQE